LHPVTFDKVVEIKGHKFVINNPTYGKGCFVGILHKIFSQLSSMHSHHCKVFVCLQIYHLHDYSADNELFSDFIQKYKKRLKRRFKLIRIGFVWVREHGEGEAQHYHLVLFLDGNKIQFHHHVFDLAEEIWVGWNQPRPAFPSDKSFYNLKRDDWSAIDGVLYHLSYMAKVHTKERKPLTINRYDGSRLKSGSR
jgi:hypothetical protein